MADPENKLLASLSPEDAAVLRPALKRVHLEPKTVLYEPGSRIKAVYFPTGAVISLVVSLSSGEQIEAAMVGRDGVVGAASALDGKLSLTQANVQLGGGALSCPAQTLKDIALRQNGILSSLIRHEQVAYAQAQQSTACMAAHNIEARLSRWLLRAMDLANSDRLPFTQQLLAEMLGVQRSSVTLIAHTLQQAGMIKYSRGMIQVLNAEALRETSCECYEAVNGYYAALSGKE